MSAIRYRVLHHNMHILILFIFVLKFKAQILIRFKEAKFKEVKFYRKMYNIKAYIDVNNEKIS